MILPLRRLLSDLTFRAIRATSRPSHGTNGSPRELRMLMYHRVTDAHPDSRLCVSVERFAQQMRFLHEQGYRTISFAQAVEWLRHPETRNPKPETFPSHPVVLTFDDGFEDNIRSAVPAMARYGFTGSFFVPSGFIEQGQAIHPAEDRPMSWGQLKELIASGHEVGAHSVSHAKLTRIPLREMRWEIQQSRNTLEQGLGHPVDFFCYPSGDYNVAVKHMVEACCYRGACTVEPGANTPGIDPFVLKRTEVSAEDSLWDFEKKLAGAYDWLHAGWQHALRVKRALR